MPLGDPPVSLPPTLYATWLAENPKEVVGGPIRIATRLTGDKPLPFFEAQKFDSQVLPAKYAKDLMIFGNSNKYDGFRIWATPRGFDYLLMAHHRHIGPLTTHDGRTFGDHPHFHELDLYRQKKTGEPSTKRIVTEALWPDMSEKDLLDAFAEHYFFEHGGGSLESEATGEKEMPESRARQQDLSGWFNE